MHAIVSENGGSLIEAIFSLTFLGICLGMFFHARVQAHTHLEFTKNRTEIITTAQQIASLAPHLVQNSCREDFSISLRPPTTTLETVLHCKPASAPNEAIACECEIQLPTTSRHKKVMATFLKHTFFLPS